MASSSCRRRRRRRSGRSASTKCTSSFAPTVMFDCTAGPRALPRTVVWRPCRRPTARAAARPRGRMALKRHSRPLQAPRRQLRCQSRPHRRPPPLPPTTPTTPITPTPPPLLTPTLPLTRPPSRRRLRPHRLSRRRGTAPPPHPVSTTTSSSSSRATTDSDSSTVDLSTAHPPSTTTSSTSEETRTSDSSVNVIPLISATLSDGSVTVITRSSVPFTTTLPDGQTSTIEAVSSSLTTLGNGATSVVYMTDAPPAAGAPSTLTSTTVVGAPASATSTSSSSTHSASNGGGSNTNTPPAGTIAGGVVGGAAGLAVILVFVMLFLRWYRRKAIHHHALPPNSGASVDDQTTHTLRGPGMAERAGLAPVIPSLFRHSDRSRETISGQGSERGFTRVSGRKLPSNFSPGMSRDGALSIPERNLSSASFYRDSTGFYGGDGSLSPITPTMDGSIVGASEGIALSPGPQRRPTVHAGGPYTTMNVASPQSSHFERSETPVSLEPNRGSRFTEEV
ncbi:hypothetical protein K470DRAFT_135969 [Piedraia hortae CBS 480.64]|uniref:Mid2 domain-containing protein n=1 Tax=Piedraia hortae CBS 480.64 TaxID=1314780 RepID=A0A6A7BTL4_9PEZI|nr:hypothetical protein K470DRAFT_135969 [Piedraia hortae CBS 480.64]